MAKLEKFVGDVKLISGILPNGGKDIALLDAHYIAVDEKTDADGKVTFKRLDERLEELANNTGGGESGGSGLYVLDLQVEAADGEEAISGELTAEQCSAIVANAPNVVIKMSGLDGEGLCVYLPLMLEADGMWVFAIQMDMSLIAVMVDCANNAYAVQISEASQGGGSDNGGDNTGSNIDAESILTEAKNYADTVARNAKDEAKNYAKSYTDTAIANAWASYITEIDSLVGGGL